VKTEETTENKLYIDFGNPQVGTEHPASFEQIANCLKIMWAPFEPTYKYDNDGTLYAKMEGDYDTDYIKFTPYKEE